MDDIYTGSENLLSNISELKNHSADMVTACFATGLLSLLITTFNYCDAAPKVNYQEEMRKFIGEISQFAKGKRSGFQVVVQNAVHLLNNNGNTAKYLAAIDGVSQPALFFGFFALNKQTPPSVTNTWKPLLNTAKTAKKQIFVTDFSSDPKKIQKSYDQNNQAGFISFVADKRQVSDIPKFPAKLNGLNTNNIVNVKDAKNFLYLVNPSYKSKAEFIRALQATSYDLLVIDNRFGGETISTSDVNSLKSKHGGGRRLVFCYVPIGEADTTRKYWKYGWHEGFPSFIGRDYPKQSSNHKVKFWDPRWKSIVFSGHNSQMSNVINTGYDGAFLDAAETYVYYEDLEESERKKRMALGYAQ